MYPTFPYLDTQTPVLARIGDMETRLARTAEEVHSALRLRHEIFHGGDERQAGREPEIDIDRFDAFCDHLLVFDGDEIVGTYRLLLGNRALDAAGSPGFYSANEFDLDGLFRSNPQANILELGRSCIAKPYRNKRTMELLWAGTWAYAVQHKIDILFGCASFEGTELAKHRNTLAWLGASACLDTEQDCAASQQSSISLPQLQSHDHQADPRRAIAGLPPLLKGYLRLGAKVASQAFVDEAFGSIDVLVVLKVADINPRYLAHYGTDASRFAA